VNLLHVVAQLDPGGAERIVVQLATDAIELGDAVVVASGGGLWVEQVRAVGAGHETVALGRRSIPATLGAAARLAVVARRFRPDVVHAHNVRATAAVAPALLGLRPRPALITTLHGVAPTDYPSAARTLRVAGGTVVACVPAVGRALVDAGFPASRMDVITNGAALPPALPAERAAVRTRFALGRRPLVVGIGRLVAQKAWWTLLAAAEGFEPSEVIVAGDGPLKADLEAAAAVRGGRVRFIGRVENPQALISLATCVVSTSIWEGLPLSILEALALGAPVVATAVDGVADLIPPEAALLVPPGDPGAVTAAVNRILTEPGLARRLSRAARQAGRGWTPEAMLARYRERYAVALDSTR
jgi:glycosyltransferase involved in cell wall biosynthesis